jgi:hypothetical protein
MGLWSSVTYGKYIYINSELVTVILICDAHKSGISRLFALEEKKSWEKRKVEQVYYDLCIFVVLRNESLLLAHNRHQ